MNYYLVKIADAFECMRKEVVEANTLSEAMKSVKCGNGERVVTVRKID